MQRYKTSAFLESLSRNRIANTFTYRIRNTMKLFTLIIGITSAISLTCGSPMNANERLGHGPLDRSKIGSRVQKVALQRIHSGSYLQNSTLAKEFYIHQLNKFVVTKEKQVSYFHGTGRYQRYKHELWISPLNCSILRLLWRNIYWRTTTKFQRRFRHWQL